MGASLSNLPGTNSVPQDQGHGGTQVLAGAQGVQMQDCNTTVIGGNSTVINNYYNNVPLDHLSKIVIEEIPVIARWLTTTNYLKIHRDVLRKRTPNTLRWFFVIPEFEAWLNSEGGILWGTGIPGAGKTVLSSAIIDFLLKMEQQSQKRICVLFMYCRYTEPIPVKDILAALVKQLLERYSSLVWQFIKPFYDHHQESGTSPSQQDLLDLLQQISNSGVFSMSYYVIDGLDEAPGDVQIDIISAFNSMGINFCLTSRPIDSLKEYVPRAVYVNIVVKNPDVLLLIEQRVERMPALRRLLKDPAVKQEVVSAILSKSSGMFLLVSLQLDAVRDCLSVKDLRDALATLPNGVKDMYAATIARISSQANAHLARRVLLWVTHAQRPLLAQELRYAIATCPQTRKFEAERLVDEDFLLSLSCGLVILDPESRQVRLIHYTAWDYLSQYISTYCADPDAEIASTCAARLLQCGFHNFEPKNMPSVEAHFQAYPMLEYANVYMEAHTPLCHSTPPLVLSFIEQCKSYPLQEDSWKRRWDYLDRLHVAIMYDASHLLERYIAESEDVNRPTILGTRPLMLAARFGRANSTKVLLGVDSIRQAVNAADINGRTALMKASVRGHDLVVKALLEVPGIDVNLADSIGITALLDASLFGKAEAVAVLLGARGIDVNKEQPESGVTPLILASWQGYEDVVRVLLQSEDVDMDHADLNGRTAYALAWQRRHHGVVKLFADRVCRG